MKYVDDYRNNAQIRMLVKAICKEAKHPWQIMEICGGQTHAIARYKIDEMLPSGIKLLHGPGCPVCVTPEQTIDHAIEIAKLPEVIFASFGDMIRVPGSKTDLLKIRAQGADINILYSPLDAIELAVKNPRKEVVFFAIGFETTAPVHIMALNEAIRRNLKNFSLLTSLFMVPPAIEMILSQSDNQVDGFLTAGHVCAITGNSIYHQLADRYKHPMIVTGFEPADLLYGIYKCILQLEKNDSRVENAYKRAVPENGNRDARKLMENVLEPVDSEWRGLGIISSSGLHLRKIYDAYNAAKKFPLKCRTTTSVKSGLSPSCIAGEIMKGNKHVSDCPSFGRTCNPGHPLGAPMVSTEGVCAAYYNYK